MPYIFPYMSYHPEGVERGRYYTNNKGTGGTWFFRDEGRAPARPHFCVCRPYANGGCPCFPAGKIIEMINKKDPLSDIKKSMNKMKENKEMNKEMIEDEYAVDYSRGNKRMEVNIPGFGKGDVTAYSEGKHLYLDCFRRGDEASKKTHKIFIGDDEISSIKVINGQALISLKTSSLDRKNYTVT